VKEVNVSSLGRNVSVLGFGCASLGSRIGARPGLLALEQAFDAGISWYDVAPSYGDGNAEAILGNFLVSDPLQLHHT
jgi:aryl-alcohol dehydrogenase-like predicted oxidoreductase